MRNVVSNSTLRVKVLYFALPAYFGLKYRWVSRKEYRQVSNALVGNEIVDQSNVVGASPIDAAPTTSSFST